MLSFHNDPAIKKKYLDRVVAHRKADRIIQGTGWENGKGCAVGCILENYDHEQYPIELGLPVWFAKLQDRIFEGLTNKDAMFWPEISLDAIPVGISIEKVRHKLAIRRLDRLIKLQSNLLEKNNSIEDVIKSVILSIKQVKSCHEAELSNSFCDWGSARSAAYSAYYAAYSADSDSGSAAYSAYYAAGSAAYSADSDSGSAAYSAYYAADSAVGSPDSAVDSAFWKQESEDLLELLKEAK